MIIDIPDSTIATLRQTMEEAEKAAPGSDITQLCFAYAQRAGALAGCVKLILQHVPTRRQELEKQRSDAGDRRDWDECTRIEIEIDSLERNAQ